MKLKIFKSWLILVLVTTLATLATVPIKAERAIDVAREKGFKLEEKYQPKGSIITEINTGQILWQEDANKLLPPASMSKLRTILLADDAIETGKFNENTVVVANEKHLDIGSRHSLSNNKVLPGASYTASELIDLIILPSSAAATYMLADLIEPDPDKYAALLNEKAKALGMSNTTYYNPIGVINKYLTPYQPTNQSLSNDNMTSASDYALLSTYLVKNHPDLLNHTKVPNLVIKKGTSFEEKLTTYHHSLGGAKYSLEGTDGIKTGSALKGFNYSSTAKRGDTRLIEVVLGVSTWEDQAGEEIRHLVGNAIMEKAFAEYEYKMILPKGKHVINEQKIVIKEDFWDCVPKNQEIPLILENNKVKVNLERTYLPGYEAPAVAFSAAPFSLIDFISELSFSQLILLIAITIIILGLIITVIFLRRRKKRQRKIDSQRHKGKRYNRNHS